MIIFHCHFMLTNCFEKYCCYLVFRSWFLNLQYSSFIKDSMHFRKMTEVTPLHLQFYYSVLYASSVTCVGTQLSAYLCIVKYVLLMSCYSAQRIRKFQWKKNITEKNPFHWNIFLFRKFTPKNGKMLPRFFPPNIFPPKFLAPKFLALNVLQKV